MKTLKGTRTEKNLLTAFVGESQARNRYTYFSSQARKEGYQQIMGEFLKPGDSSEATFEIKAEKITAREYCTLHGLWKKGED